MPNKQIEFYQTLNAEDLYKLLDTEPDNKELNKYIDKYADDIEIEYQTLMRNKKRCNKITQINSQFKHITNI